MTETEKPKRMNLRDASKLKTTEKVTAAARKLFDSEGYEEAKIREIAREAGMSTGAFFASYASKEEAYIAIYGHAPVKAEDGQRLLEIVRTFAANAGNMQAKEPFGVGFGELVALAQGLVEELAPEVGELQITERGQATDEAIAAHLNKTSLVKGRSRPHRDVEYRVMADYGEGWVKLFTERSRIVARRHFRALRASEPDAKHRTTGPHRIRD